MVENMNRKILFKKTLVFIITVSFIFSINSFTNAVSKNIDNISSLNEKIKNNNLKDNISVTSYIFQRDGIKKCKVMMSSYDVNELYNKFIELNIQFSNYPFDDKTQILKKQFIDELNKLGLIPKDIPSTKYSSLLNPSWLSHLKNNNISLDKYPYKSAYAGFGASLLCSIASWGSGWIMPPIMLPRPRLTNGWIAFAGATYVASLIFYGMGFISEGFSIGLTLGSIGIGLTFAIPGVPPFYGFIGYALFIMCYGQYY
jgi:hypothetical protein